MEDTQILTLFWGRSEDAITETQRKYGAYCHAVAKNLLGNEEDAEECVSDAMHAAWREIPPARPENLRLWLGRVTRNQALTRCGRAHRQKRSGMTVLLDELEECLPAGNTAEETAELHEVTEAISRYLASLSRDDRTLFLRRYFDGESVKTLARVWGQTQSKVAGRLYRIRGGLRAALEKEGITV